MATVDEIAAAVAGLRDLADLIEQQPNTVTRTDLTGVNMLFCRIDRDEFIASVKALGPFDEIDTKPDDKYLVLLRRFGPITLQLYIERSKLGEPRTEMRATTTFALEPEVTEALAEAAR